MEDIEKLFDDVENKILKSNLKIRFANLLKKNRKDKTLEEFLFRFFTEFNVEKDTIYASDKRLQTQSKKRRSISDIYMLCKYYYPESKLIDVYRILLTVLPNKIEKGYRMSYCHATKKYMFYYSPSNNNAVYDRERKNEFDLTLNEINEAVKEYYQ
jgi:hypothetical protein